LFATRLSCEGRSGAHTRKKPIVKACRIFEKLERKMAGK